LWYDNEKNDDKDEPTKGDLYGYTYYGNAYGVTVNKTAPYVCQFSIQDCIDQAEKDAAKAEKEAAKNKS